MTKCYIYWNKHRNSILLMYLLLSRLCFTELQLLLSRIAYYLQFVTTNCLKRLGLNTWTADYWVLSTEDWILELLITECWVYFFYIYLISIFLYLINIRYLYSINIRYRYQYLCFETSIWKSFLEGAFVYELFVLSLKKSLKWYGTSKDNLIFSFINCFVCVSKLFRIDLVQLFCLRSQAV